MDFLVILKELSSIWTIITTVGALLTIIVRTKFEQDYIIECENTYGVPKKYFCRDLLTIFVNVFLFSLTYVPSLVLIFYLIFFYRNEYSDIIMTLVCVLFLDIIIPLLSYAIKKNCINRTKLSYWVIIIFVEMIISIALLMKYPKANYDKLGIILIIIYIVIYFYVMAVCIKYFFISQDILKNILKYEVVSYDGSKYLVVSHYRDYYVLLLIGRIDLKQNIVYFKKGKYRVLGMDKVKQIEYIGFKEKKVSVISKK